MLTTNYANYTNYTNVFTEDTLFNLTYSERFVKIKISISIHYCQDNVRYKLFYQIYILVQLFNYLNS